MFSKNRDRLLTTDIARKFLAAILAHAQVAPLLSDEHFSVDGTLIRAWASMKSFQPKPDGVPPDEGNGPGDPPSARTEDAPEQTKPETTEMTRPTSKVRSAEVDFRGKKRSNGCHWSAIGSSDNGNHASVTDPEARLYRKSPGAGATLCFMGHTLMENRSGLVVQADPDAGRRPRRTARRHRHARPPFTGLHTSPHARGGVASGCATGSSTAGDGFDSADFVADLRRMCVTPQVARKARHSAIDGRTTRHAGYAMSQKRRKKIEEPFGWAKTVGGMAQTTLRGAERVRARVTLTMAACNLARLPRLLAA